MRAPLGSELGGGPGTAIFLGLRGDEAWFAQPLSTTPIADPQRIDLRTAAMRWPAFDSTVFAQARDRRVLIARARPLDCLDALRVLRVRRRRRRERCKRQHESGDARSAGRARSPEAHRWPGATERAPATFRAPGRSRSTCRSRTVTIRRPTSHTG